MRAVDLIRKKRDGGELSGEELGHLLKSYPADEIPDYQMSAFLMAVFFRGMTAREMTAMTDGMRRSGVALDLTSIPARKVDKHSTGGVGDKTSLVLAPAVAAAGVAVPMISGRGLGHTGGTLDKLESIPGFNVRLGPERFMKMMASIGVCLIGQTTDFVPADRKLYALRDVTATVESYPLIAASIMSKKLAEGIDGLVLDVTTGSGAFMQRQEEAERLAAAMVEIGKSCGKKVVALITDMNQPLGEYVGNSLEVIECLEVLKGRGPKDLISLCEELSAYCLVLGEAAPDLEEAREIYRGKIASGEALEKFREIIRLQDGDPAVLDDYRRLPAAKHHEPLLSPAAGFVQSIDTRKAGIAMCVLGAGRDRVDSGIDPAVGMRVHKKIGDAVGKGEALCTLFYNDENRLREARELLLESYNVSQNPCERPVLVKRIIQ